MGREEHAACPGQIKDGVLEAWLSAVADIPFRREQRFHVTLLGLETLGDGARERARLRHASHYSGGAPICARNRRLMASASAVSPRRGRPSSAGDIGTAPGGASSDASASIAALLRSSYQSAL